MADILRSANIMYRESLETRKWSNSLNSLNKYRTRPQDAPARKSRVAPCRKNSYSCASSDVGPSYSSSDTSSDKNSSWKQGAFRSKAPFAKLLKGMKFKKNQTLNSNNIGEHTGQHSMVGKVGYYGRQGNVALASFGLPSHNLRETKKSTDLAKALSQMLPYIVVLTALSALTEPRTFTWFTKQYFAPALGGIMLSIGIQLSLSDFLLVFRRPLPVLIGYIGQYSLKPLLALLVASFFQVPPEFSAGFLLTASVAGAQLASYGAYLADADVALSIVLTSLTTMTSVFATPLLSQLLIGSVVPVDGVAMAKSILQVVIFPIFLGLALNTYCQALVDRIRPLMPVLAIVCTSLCVGAPLAANRASLLCPQGLLLLFPVVVFHILAFCGGYWLPKLPFWRQEEKTARTLSICTGMQSSTLAMLLASQFLGASQSVPPAMSVVIMAVAGLSLGSFWGKGHKISDHFEDLFRKLSSAPIRTFV